MGRGERSGRAMGVRPACREDEDEEADESGSEDTTAPEMFGDKATSSGEPACETSAKSVKLMAWRSLALVASMA